MLGKLWQQVKEALSPRVSEEELRHQLDRLRDKMPVPVFWLLGRTQSGKSSIVRFLTGAEKAEIGKGYQPCTRFSSKYHFPNTQTPLMTFLDTRGLDEPGYEAAEDIARFNDETHVVLVTVRLLDHSQQNLIAALKRIRSANRSRPVILVLTCLHEAYPRQQHPQPYPFDDNLQPTTELPTALVESLAEQQRRFDGLIDQVVAVDLTPKEEGFDDPDYGGARLHQLLVELLPSAQAQTLRTLDAARNDLQDLFGSKATPTIVAYSTLAATVGAVPLPFVDLVLISGVQTKMLYDLASLYGQPMTKQRLGELAGALGLGLLGRQAGRSLIKAIPGLGSILGSVAGGALAAASTYALGKAFCFYYSAVLKGHVPDPRELRRYYAEQLDLAQTAWKQLHEKEKP